MKGFMYSSITKALAALLLIASVVLGALTAVNAIAEYYSEKEQIYRFESNFEDARFFSSLLDAPECEIFNAYHNYMNSGGERVSYSEQEDLSYKDLQVTEKGVTVNAVLPVGGQRIEQIIEQRLNALYCADKIDYFVKWNDSVFTNCGATSEKSLVAARFYRLTKMDENGNSQMETSQRRYYSYPLLDELSLYDVKVPIVVCTSIKEAYADECKAVWERQAAVVNGAFKTALVCVIAALLLMIYLLSVCGRNKDGGYKRLWLDNIWVEVHLAAAACIGFCAAAVCVILLDDYFSGHFPRNLMNVIVGLSAALASAVFITALLSVVRNVKCRSFAESSAVVRIVRWCMKMLRSVLRLLHSGFTGFGRIALKTLSKKSGVILIAMLFVYTVLICGFGIGMTVSVLWAVPGVLLFLSAGFVAGCRAGDVDEIKKGVSEVRGGNTAYKIPKIRSEDMKALADDINDIAKGIDESVAAKVKAERMKTELITNVSHDLKTPLTSIISYTELLSGVEGLPEEARDYVRIIANKSDRLKTLTQDLFDISRVQSGNENVVLERLDVSLLINQSLGEHDSEIRETGLTLCISTPKELCICADGKKMSRVISNLIDNILKYTMKNTRVFISAFEKDGDAVMEFKNIASYPMDFNAEEIVGRFVRGDEARTRDGNGLGLAIAKSYTELCGGEFRVITDGDLFKALLRFKKCS